MQGLRQCEYFLIEYRPDRARGEYLNIGTVLREVVSPEDRGAGETRLLFTRDWRRVRCLDPDADISKLEQLEADIRLQLESSQEASRPFIEVMINSWSNDLTLSVAKGCLAENLPAKLEGLMEMFVYPPKREPVAKKSRRQVIHEAMRTQFERADVWKSMRKRIAVAPYTDRADNLRIDCGYRNGGVRMFHAVALDELDAAKILAFTSAKLAAGVKRLEGVDLELTAVIEPLQRDAEGQLQLDQEQQSIYDAGKKTMEENGIQVITTHLLPQIAQAARLHILGQNSPDQW
jgi:hypothetical protein